MLLQIQGELVGAVTGNKWWGSLKHRIRDFAIKYGRQHSLDRSRMEKSLEDKLSTVVEREDSLTPELVTWTLNVRLACATSDT